MSVKTSVQIISFFIESFEPPISVFPKVRLSPNSTGIKEPLPDLFCAAIGIELPLSLTVRDPDSKEFKMSNATYFTIPFPGKFLAFSCDFADIRPAGRKRREYRWPQVTYTTNA